MIAGEFVALHSGGQVETIGQGVQIYVERRFAHCGDCITQHGGTVTRLEDVLYPKLPPTRSYIELNQFFLGVPFPDGNTFHVGKSEL